MDRGYVVGELRGEGCEMCAIAGKGAGEQVG